MSNAAIDLGAVRMTSNSFMMSNRELRRVPLDFDWPVGEIWKGYLNPFAKLAIKCSCQNGYSPAASFMKEQWYGNVAFDPLSTGSEPYTSSTPEIRALAERSVANSPQYYGRGPAAIELEARRLADLFNRSWSHHVSQADVDALVDGDRLWDFTRRPRTPEQAEQLKQQEADGLSSYWLTEPNGYRPTAKEVNLWSINNGFGHDSINAWVCIKARCTREGIEHQCARCGGDGSTWPSPEIEKAYENWESEDPPVGEGYQLWETCSEGSPMSPVFVTLRELANYAAHHCSVSGSQYISAAGWMARFNGEQCEEQIKSGDAGPYPEAVAPETAWELSEDAICLGTGHLVWYPAERRTDRYGAVFLVGEEDGISPLPLDPDAEARHGRLIARVIETMTPTHVGDTNRGIKPTIPKVGESIVLGLGTVFYENGTVGVRPDLDRKIDWMNPLALYRCVDQWVELCFDPD